MFKRGCIPAMAILLAALSQPSPSVAQPKIGVASAITNSVEGTVGGRTQALASGSEVFSNELLRTAEESTAKLVFLDDTNMGVGPKSQVRLDRFVYNPDRGTGKVVVEVSRGVFRFVTGTQDPRNHTIKTPVVVIGVRGTSFELLVERRYVKIVLWSGTLLLRTLQGRELTMTGPAEATFYADGRVDGPRPYGGGTVMFAGNVPFPYFGNTQFATAPVPAFGPVPGTVLSLGNWTGFYAGANVGYSMGRTGHNYRDTTGVGTSGLISTTASDTIDVNGAIGGGQAGVNFQLGNVVLGLETDFEGSAQRGSNTLLTCIASNLACDGVTLSRTYTERLDWFGTSRGRVGLAFGSLLLYGTGGAAYGEISLDSTTTAIAGGVGTASLSTRQIRTGWVAGGGLEAAFLAGWSWRIEYLHIDFGAIGSSTVPVAGIIETTYPRRLTDEIVRMGVSYQFGWLGIGGF